MAAYGSGSPQATNDDTLSEIGALGAIIRLGDRTDNMTPSEFRTLVERDASKMIALNIRYCEEVGAAGAATRIMAQMNRVAFSRMHRFVLRTALEADPASVALHGKGLARAPRQSAKLLSDYCAMPVQHMLDSHHSTAAGGLDRADLDTPYSTVSDGRDGRIVQHMLDNHHSTVGGGRARVDVPASE